MPRKNVQPKQVDPLSSSAFEQASSSVRARRSPPPTVSGRWLVGASGISIAAAAACAWATLCLLFWQGSWQLLYHPVSAVARTPASAGLAFEPVGFADTEAGQPRLKGWWIPAGQNARYSRYTVLYLHGQDGNLGNAVDALAALHSAGVNVLAFDYRGYGQSLFEHPSEARWREDAEWALEYLTATRHTAVGTIILDGRGLGADLALEVAAQHPELAGAVIDSPIEAPAEAIFRDPRARLVPAHWLVRDRFDLNAPAEGLRIPSLWLVPASEDKHGGVAKAFQKVNARKTLAWLTSLLGTDNDRANSFSIWLKSLSS
ncbi:MAG: alpha/beta fold hydrolase [Terracidiphilus sp.]|jgi:pimeloyl-ACP methyl ester carboxylesterase